MIGRTLGDTWKYGRVLSDAQIAEIMTREHGLPMGKTAVTDTAARAEQKLFESPILRELVSNLWGTP